jgi:hypothetical protein
MKEEAAPMTLTLDIRPEVQAELARQAAAQGRAIESVAASLLEGAVHLPTATPAKAPEPHRTGQELIDICSKVRGWLTDDEIDRMFSRNPSTARPVDLS